MKTLIFSVMITIFALLSLFAVADIILTNVIMFVDPSRTDFMSTKEVCERWGCKSFNIEQFKSASKDETTRAEMVCSLLFNQKDYVGMDHGEIRNLFGSPDGYYVSDHYFAYIIEDGETIEEDTWQIVFLTDRIGNVSEIVVHKNCCDDRTRKEIRSSP